MLEFIAVALPLYGCWVVLGCVVLSAIDTDDKQLFEWARSCPLPGGLMLVITAWPVILFLVLRSKENTHDE